MGARSGDSAKKATQDPRSAQAPPGEPQGSGASETGVSRRKVLAGVGAGAVSIAGAAIAGSRPAAAASFIPPESSPVADTVLYGGQVITVDPAFSIAQAVAVKNGRIMAVGKTGDILQLANSASKKINLHGNTVVPGITDAHAHMDREGMKYFYPSLASAKSVDDVLAIVAGEVKKAKPGEWIVTMPIGGPPFFRNNVPGAVPFPTRWQLDTVSPNNPVYIRGIWGFWASPPVLSSANSMALQVAGVTRETPAPYSGITIMKDADGEPTGVFSESNSVPALEFSLFKMVPRFTHEMRVKGLKDSMRRYNSVGTTSVFEGHGIASEIMSAYKELWANGEMTVRSYLVLSPTPGKTIPQLDEMVRDWAVTSNGIGFGDGMLTTGGVNLQAGGDPALAAILRGGAPYTAWASYYYTNYSTAQWNQALAMAAQYGVRVVGGISGEDALSQLETLDAAYRIRDKRWVIQHMGSVTASQIQRIKRLGIVPQTLAAGLWKTGSTTLANTPVERRGDINPYKSVMDAGIPLTLATDNVPPEPFTTMWAAIARVDEKTGSVIVPEQRLSREQGLRAMTINGAYLTFEEKVKGSLEPGKFADLVVIEEDFLKVPEEKIKDIKPVITMVGGNIVYQK